MKRREFLHIAGGAIVLGQLRDDYDVIIVGAGASGCVLANRLSADPALRVLLIEAGDRAPENSPLTIPGRWVSLLGSPWDWNYTTEIDPGLDGRAIKWPRGKVYGGSSAINAMAYVRGDARCYDGWARTTDATWNYASVEPYFARVERDLVIADTKDPHVAHAIFMAAARERGYDPFYYKKTIRNGRRYSAADAFLAPALSRSNLTVLPNTLVGRVRIESGRAIGVEVIRNGGRETLRATREIVLSAGVIGSPKILLLSDVTSANVGANLHDHPRVSLRWKSLKTLPPSTTSAGMFVRSEEPAGPPIADLQFYVGRGVDTPDDFITLTVALSQPRSRGSLTLRSNDPAAAPIIKPNYFQDDNDLEAMVEGVRLARELVAHRAYQPLRGAPVDPPAEIQTPEAIRAWIRRSADTIFHPVGTCRMGRDAEAVVDPQLRVRGVARLRVADGSIMPVVVNSQTQAACLMIAEKAAALIRDAR